MRTTKAPDEFEPVVTRKEAAAKGDKRYFTGKPCKHGHVDFRTTSNGMCMECSRIKALKRMRENPEAVRKSRECNKRRYHNDESFRESVKERSRAWHHANREKANEAKREWYRENSERASRACRMWREKQLLDPEWVEKERERKRREHRDHPHRRIASYNARRAREKRFGGKVTAKDILEKLESQGERCVYCNVSLAGGYEVDHIMPLSKGGTNWPSNIQCLCQKCNRRKAAKHPDDFAKEMGLL